MGNYVNLTWFIHKHKPCGKPLVCYWKWLWMMDLPLKKWWFAIVMLVYQRACMVIYPMDILGKYIYMDLTIKNVVFFMGISWEWYRLVSWPISGVFDGNSSGDQAQIYQLTMIYWTLKLWGVPWCTPLSIFEWNIYEHMMLRVKIIYSMGISGDQWPFQVPKLEVRTIYKAYVYGLNVRGDASNIWDQWYTVIYGDTWWYI